VPDDFFTASFNPFKTIFSPYRGGGRQGQVFIDDAEMTEAKDLFKYDRKTRTRTTEKLGMDLMYEQPNSWATEDGQTIYLHLPAGAKAPDQCRVEISVRRRCFAPVRRAQNYIIVRGFTFEHCANGAAFPQMGMVSCRSGQHWIIENNTIRWV
jgi:hypothetical protein